MASIVLRASGLSLDVDTCLARIPQLRAEDCYRAGDAKRNGSTHRESGFTLSLADDDDAGAAVSLARRHLASLATVLPELVAGGSAEIDCGLFVQAMAMQSIALEPAWLAQLAALGIAVRVSAYPCADENVGQQ